MEERVVGHGSWGRKGVMRSEIGGGLAVANEEGLKDKGNHQSRFTLLMLERRGGL